MLNKCKAKFSIQINRTSGKIFTLLLKVFGLKLVIIK